MFERFTADARRTVVLAQEEARMLHHDFVGTEHLLLALTLDHGAAGQALNGLGVTHDVARGHILEAMGEGISPVAGASWRAAGRHCRTFGDEGRLR
ncbi:Clp protease N-terminal domain-containing protein [Arthrobacter sp. NPDC056691]|uniref:Clp protease N-terminal domain-containing protein n=1 Tax=Arthrobacter sp. NPDC056691 TaxID=3345913 RepID=UPI00367330DE